MNRNEHFLANVRIASPCNARWADMDGNERSRFCRSCTKQVYNLSEMTAQEAADLIRARGGKLCARFYQRADGTMLTADCPVGAERPLHWAKRFISAIAACFCLSGPPALAGEKPRERALLGDVCVTIPRTNVVTQTTTNHPAFLGRIAMPPIRVNPAGETNASPPGASPSQPTNKSKAM
jgi:hypothetical protein